MNRQRASIWGRTPLALLLGPATLLCLAAAPPSAKPLPSSPATLAPSAIGVLSLDEEAVELTLTKLMAAKYEPGKPIDDEILDYDGKTVEITGLMALGTLEGQEDFELTSDSCGCGQSKVNHFVKVILAEDTTRYTPTEFTVVGTFEASEEIVDGFVVSVYRLKDAKIKDE